MRTTDKSKKSNKKCEHCEFFHNDKCNLKNEDKKYFNYCKSFYWNKKLNYKGDA